MIARHFMKPVFTFLVLIVIITGAAVPAYSGTSSERSNKGDGGPIRVIFSPFSTQSFALSVIQKFGLDRAHGFQFVTVPGGSTEASLSAIQSGSANIADFNWLDLARLNSNGGDVVAIAPTLEFGADYFLVPQQSSIRNVGDWKGKRIGTSSRANVDWALTLAEAKQRYHMDLDRDVRIQEASPNLLRGLLQQNQLDGSIIYNNIAPDLIAGGKFKSMAQLKDFASDLRIPSAPFLMFVASRKYIAAHPNNVRAFAAAYREAVGILRTRDDAWRDHAREVEMSPQALPILMKEMRQDMWTEFKPDSDATIRKTFDVLKSAVGPKVLGIENLPDGIITTAFQ
jgi:NitT/TauT family transport system substrate-binding protein